MSRLNYMVAKILFEGTHNCCGISGSNLSATIFKILSRMEQGASMPIVFVDKEIVVCGPWCLHNVDAKNITILWFMALKTSNCEEQSTWLIDTLWGYLCHLTTMRSTHKEIICVTRIKEKKICNACFALAIGYSRSGLAHLIREIRKNVCHKSIHRNWHCWRKHNNITMVRVLFEQYIRDFGEPLTVNSSDFSFFKIKNLLRIEKL